MIIITNNPKKGFVFKTHLSFLLKRIMKVIDNRMIKTKIGPLINIEKSQCLSTKEKNEYQFFLKKYLYSNHIIKSLKLSKMLIKQNLF